MATKKKFENKAEDCLTQLLELLEIKANFKMKSSIDKDSGEDMLDIAIKPDVEAGLLIGSHGSTLMAIQSFLALTLKQSTGEWVRVSIDVDGWRQKQEDYLDELATQASQRARSTGEPQNLYNLSPAQRRLIHLSLEKEKGIVTQSKGEGEGRYLVVLPE